MNSSFEKLLGWDKKGDEIRRQSRTGHVPLANLGLKNAMIGMAHDSIFGNKWLAGGKDDRDHHGYHEGDDEDTAEILGEISERLDAINRTVEDVFHTQKNIEVLAQKILHLKSLSTGNKDSSFPAAGGVANSDSENKNDATQTSGGGVLATVGLVVVIKKIYNLITKKGAKWAVTRLIKRYGVARASLFVGKFIASSALTASGIGTALGVAGIAWMAYEAYDILTRDEEDKVDPSVQGTLDIFKDMDKKRSEESGSTQAAGLLGKLEKDSLAKAQSDRLGGYASKFPLKSQEVKIESKHGKIRFKANEIIFESKNIRGLAGGRPSTPGGSSSNQGTFNPYKQEHSSDEQSMDSRMREMDGRQAPGGSGGGSGGSGGYSGGGSGGGGYSGGGSSGSPLGGSPSATGVPSPSQPGFQQPQLGRWSSMPKAMVDEKSFSVPRVEYAAPSGPGSFAGQPTLAPFLGQGPGQSQDGGFSPEEMSSYGSAFQNYHPEGSAGMAGRGVPSGVPRDGTKTSEGQGQPSSGTGIDRTRFAEEMKNNPDVARRLMSLAKAEVGSQGDGAIQRWMETVANRAYAQGKTVERVIDPNNGYWPSGQRRPGLSKDEAEKYQGIFDKVFSGSGSNMSDYATDNASAGLARRREESGRKGHWVNGEFFYTDFHYRKAMDRLRTETEKRSSGSEIAKEQSEEPDAEREEVRSDERGIEVDAKKQAERPRHLSGSVSLPAVDGFEAQSYRAGSGGGGRGSMPYGSHPVSGTRQSGPVITNAVGPTPVWHVGTKQSGYQSLPDPKVGTRTAIQIHKGTDVTKLYSAGCLAIHPNEFKKFSAHMDAVVKKYGSAVLDVSPSPKGKGHTVFAIRPPGTGDPGTNSKTITADEAVSSFKRTGHVSVQDTGVVTSQSPEDARRETALADDEEEELIDPELEKEEKAEDEKAKLASEEKRNPSQTPTPWSKKGKESKDYTPVTIGPKQQEIGDGATTPRAEAPVQQQQESEKQPERSIVPPAGTMLSDTQPPHKEYNSKEAAPPVVPKGTDRPVKKDIYSESQY